MSARTLRPTPTTASRPLTPEAVRAHGRTVCGASVIHTCRICALLNKSSESTQPSLAPAATFTILRWTSMMATLSPCFKVVTVPLFCEIWLRTVSVCGAT